MLYKCVITVDVKDSRKLGLFQRKIVQTDILNLMDNLSPVLAENLFSIGMIAGDEFQVVLSSPNQLFKIHRLLQKNLEVRTYMGIGVGQVETVKKTSQPSEMYGSAFYTSRDAVNHAKKNQVDIVARTGDGKLDFMINTPLGLIDFIRKNWTRRQKEILGFMEENENMLQKQIADHFNVSEQYISKILKKTGFKLVEKGEALVVNLLEEHLTLLNTSNNKPKEVEKKKSTHGG